jgi:hypothetical protein
MPASHRRILLTPSFQRVFVPNAHDTFRVTIVASAAHELPDEIFAYRALPLQPGQTDVVAQFDHVCSPVDLQEYPEGAPDVNAVPPWFRLATLDFETRTRAQAEEFYNDVVCDVNRLIRGMDAADCLVARQPFWVGYQEAGTGSSVGSEGSLN